MKIKQLQNILDKQPSVSGNTLFVGVLYAISWVLFIAFFVLAIGLLLESAFHVKLFMQWVSQQFNITLNDDQRWKIATSFGLLSLFLSAVFVGVIFLCRMILNRNHFIIEIEDWIYGNLSEISKKPRTRTRKK